MGLGFGDSGKVLEAFSGISDKSVILYERAFIRASIVLAVGVSRVCRLRYHTHSVNTVITDLSENA